MENSVGVDIVDVERIRRAMENPRFLAEFFSPEERAASAGVFYHGKAADLCQQDMGQMYMQPLDVAHYLSKAYPKL